MPDPQWKFVVCVGGGNLDLYQRPVEIHPV